MEASEPVLEQAPLPKKKPMSALAIVLIIIGVCALVCAGLVGAAVFWVKDKAEQLVGDGGIEFVTASPDQVRAELAGAKKAYVGSWHAENGSALEVDEGGFLHYNKISEGSTSTWAMPIAGFGGDDIICKAFLTVVVRITVPPKQVDGRWVMVADGMTFRRD